MGKVRNGAQRPSPWVQSVSRVRAWEQSPGAGGRLRPRKRGAGEAALNSTAPTRACWCSGSRSLPRGGQSLGLLVGAAPLPEHLPGSGAPPGPFVPLPGPRRAEADEGLTAGSGGGAGAAAGGGGGSGAERSAARGAWGSAAAAAEGARGSAAGGCRGGGRRAAGPPPRRRCRAELSREAEPRSCGRRRSGGCSAAGFQAGGGCVDYPAVSRGAPRRRRAAAERRGAVR